MSFCLCVQASMAKLETSVAYVGDMLELKVYGFNEKLSVLLSKVLSAARSFMPTDDRYQVSGIFVLISLREISPTFHEVCLNSIHLFLFKMNAHHPYLLKKLPPISTPYILLISGEECVI